MTWRKARLEEVADVYGGGTPRRSEPSYFNGDIPWATPTDVTKLDGLYISTTKESVTEAGIKASSTKLLPAGAVLLTSRATIGFTAVSATSICTNQGFVNFVCGPDLLPEYLAYWLRTQRDKMLQFAGGTTFKEIARGTIRKFEIRFPDLAEQQRIVDLLSRAEGIVRLRREAQAKAAEIIPAVFLDMFGDPASNPKGWPIMPLGDLLVACNYGTSKKANSDGAGVPVLRMGNVNYDGSLDLSDIKHVQLDERELARQLLLPGDLLFNRTNSKDLVGKTGLWDGCWPATAASYFIRFRTDAKRVNPVYIWALLNSQHMKRVLFQTARGAIGQSNINMQELKSLMVPVPPVPAQDQFASDVQSLQSIYHQQTRALRAARTTLDSLLYRSFAPI